MAVDGRVLLDLVRSLVSAEPDVRDDACGTVTDWVSAFSPSQVQLIAILLAVAASCEEIEDSRENQLHALFELVDSDCIRPENLDAISRIDQSTLWPAEREYMKGLAEWLDEHRLAEGNTKTHG